MSTPGERPYQEDDLTGNKDSLVKLVQRQIAKWPGPGKFQPSKVKVALIKSTLLDPTYGFTTNKPPVVFLHPPKGSGGTATPVENSPPSPPHEENPAPLEFLSVRIYVEDSRVVPTHKTVAMLSLPVLNRTNGAIRIYARDIIAALQRSNGAIEIPSTGSGLVMISFPDPEDEEWKIPFVRIPHGHTGDIANFSPDVLEIPQDLRLKLNVDNISSSLPAVVNSAVSADSVTTSIPGSSTSVQLAAPLEEEPTSPVITFLREKLATKAGYLSFAANRNRVLSNPVIVSDWQFAVSFTGTYNKMKTPVKVNKEAIRKALGVGSTWLSQAHTAVDIISKYGAVTEVADTLKLAENPPSGSIVLYNFLKDWRDNHPM
ncbi:hypothetical protein B0H13DRAFT_1873354 [Mycena leptocephala]|nr:hypothetical protein B0H13DRAFT_1873354 [Mycena leptocephala]